MSPGVIAGINALNFTHVNTAYEMNFKCNFFVILFFLLIHRTWSQFYRADLGTVYAHFCVNP